MVVFPLGSSCQHCNFISLHAHRDVVTGMLPARICGHCVVFHNIITRLHYKAPCEPRSAALSCCDHLTQHVHKYVFADNIYAFSSINIVSSPLAPAIYSSYFMPHTVHLSETETNAEKLLGNVAKRYYRFCGEYCIGLQVAQVQRKQFLLMTDGCVCLAAGRFFLPGLLYSCWNLCYHCSQAWQEMCKHTLGNTYLKSSPLFKTGNNIHSPDFFLLLKL